MKEVHFTKVRSSLESEDQEALKLFNADLAKQLNAAKFVSADFKFKIANKILQEILALRFTSRREKKPVAIR